MNALPAEQKRLLDLAELDTRISQAEHARANPPQASRVRELLSRRQELTQELTVLLGTRDDLKAELGRVESDVAVVDARSARDAQRLGSTSNVKEAQGLESEIGALARRKSDLEDIELELMEKLEQAESAVTTQEALISETNSEGSTLSGEAKQIVQDAENVIAAANKDRAAIAAELPQPLVELYDRIATRSSGAALLRRATCEGCRMVLASTALDGFRNASADAVLTCPECGCILVRTEESGL